MARAIKPQGPWVLVEPHPEAEKTDGGLYRPQGNMEDRLGYSYGTVLATGPGKSKYVKGRGLVFFPTGVEVGETIYFRGHLKEANQLNEYQLDDNRCLLHQDDLLLAVED